MVSADTNCLVAYLAGERASDVEFLEKLLRRRMLVLPPIVVAELLSSPEVTPDVEAGIKGLRQLPTLDGFWERAGKLRARLSLEGHQARMADTLVAQSCLDHKTALLTRDKGFRRFAEIAGLKLV